MGKVATKSNRVFDRDLALRNVGGDRDTMLAVVQIFVDDCPRRLGAMRAALARGEADGIERSAHSIKGSASYLAASCTLVAAARLEALASTGDLTNASHACAALEHEVVRLIDALAAVVAAPKMSRVNRRRATA